MSRVKIGLMFLLGFTVGCPDVTIIGDGPNGQADGTGAVTFLVRGRSIEGFRDIFLTVESVEFLGDGDNGTVFALTPPVRVNLINGASSEWLACLGDAPAGTFGKLRLRVSNPLFVRDDETTVPATDIQLNADGKLDLNTQGDSFTIAADAFNVVEFRLATGDNALGVTQTGNGRFILRTEVFEDTNAVASAVLFVRSAVVLGVEIEADHIAIGLSNCERTVVVDAETLLLDADGVEIALDDLAPGMDIEIEGAFDTDSETILAARVQVLAG